MDGQVLLVTSLAKWLTTITDNRKLYCFEESVLKLKANRIV